MSLQQLNGSYIETEDRLLFRFTTSANEEYRLWLTRRITGTLLAFGERTSMALLEQKHAPPVAQAVDQFQQEKLAASLQSASAFAAQSKLPLGATPMLVHQVEFLELPESDAALTAIQFLLSNQQRLTLKLHRGEFDHFRSLLLQLWKRSPWGEVPRLGNAESEPAGGPFGPKSLH